jgi:hypothetical protein
MKLPYRYSRFPRCCSEADLSASLSLGVLAPAIQSTNLQKDPCGRQILGSASQSTGISLGPSADQSSLTVALVLVSRQSNSQCRAQRPSGPVFPLHRRCDSQRHGTGFLQLAHHPGKRERRPPFPPWSNKSAGGGGRKRAVGTHHLTRLSSSPQFFAVCSLLIWGGAIYCAVGGRFQSSSRLVSSP